MTHRIWRISTVLGATALTLVAGSRPFQAAGKPEESQIWGSWYVVFHAGPGLTLPALVTINREGTVTNIDGDDFAQPPFPNLHSATHGTWVGKGNGTFEAVGMFLIYDTTGNLVGIGRNLISFQFGENSDTIAGVANGQRLDCPTPFTCPDPLAEDANWQTDPAFPLTIPLTGRRIPATLPVAEEFP